MPLLKEFRIPLPINVDEYFIAQLYSVAEESKNNTGAGEGVTVVKNEPFDNERGKGQYTYKIYKLDTKVPGIIRSLAPKGSLTFHEHAWNTYPDCYTEYTNELYKDSFQLVIKSKHLPDNGLTENAFNLNDEERKRLIVENINICDPNCIPRDKYVEKYDPVLVKSEKVATLPLKPDFAKDFKPIMCCYKLYFFKCTFALVGKMIENHMASSVFTFLADFHRKLVSWIDSWMGMTIEQLRAYEDKTKEELDNKIRLP